MTVKQWRETVKLTQEQAAHVLGVTLRNFQNYEWGTYEPSKPVRKLMRAALRGDYYEELKVEEAEGDA